MFRNAKERDSCMSKQLKRWGPTEPVCPVDEIIHTQAHEQALRGIQISFTPSYEKRPINMYHIMTNEYYRMWFNEREKFEKVRYDIIASRQKENTSIKRRQIQRMMTHKRQNKYTYMQDNLLMKYGNPTPQEIKDMSLKKMKYKVDTNCPEELPVNWKNSPFKKRIKSK